MENSRFSDASWYQKASKSSVVVGGAGGIGSWLTLFLARAGFRIVVYDMDEFEQHNLGGQFATKLDIGINKAVALRSNVLTFAPGSRINAYKEYDHDSQAHKYMLAGFDNMKARKIMFYKWNYQYGNRTDAIFIDGRLLMEQMQIFCVTKDNKAEYQTNYLFDDSEVENEVCTLKQTSHSAAMIASFMTGFLTNYISNVTQDNQARSIPFNFEYFIPLNMMTDASNN